MAKRIRFCPRCMNIIHRNDKECSSCGLSMEKMLEMQLENEDKKDKLVAEAIEKANQEESEVSETEASVSAVQNPDENAVKPKRHKHKPKNKQLKKEDLPEYTVDENGEYNINTKDVTFLEDIDYKSYSKKQALGEKPAREKIKWWEIYKWADLMLARRKINKEVKKASYKIPYGISRTKMLLLCIFFGWFGAHDFYAKNNKRGWTVLSFSFVVALVINIPVLYKLMGIFVGGGLGFVLVVMWLGDLFAIITNHYKYRISKEEFISNLNVATRGKLAKRYWNLDRPTFKAREQKRIDKIYEKQNKKKLKKEKRRKKILDEIEKQKQSEQKQSENNNNSSAE